MTAAERLYQLIQTLPEDQIAEVLHFAEFLYQKQLATVAPGHGILCPHKMHTQNRQRR